MGFDSILDLSGVGTKLLDKTPSQLSWDTALYGSQSMLLLQQHLLKGKLMTLDEFWYEMHLGMRWSSEGNICSGVLEMMISLSKCRNLILKADFKGQMLRSLVNNVT